VRIVPPRAHLAKMWRLLRRCDTGNTTPPAVRLSPTRTYANPSQSIGYTTATPPRCVPLIENRPADTMVGPTETLTGGVVQCALRSEATIVAWKCE